MSAKNKRLLTVLIAATLLVWYFFPRSFTTAMPGDFDPEEMLGVQVVLMGVMGTGHETMDYTILADDPAYKDLVDLLDSKRYVRLFSSAGMDGQEVTLEYIVQMIFYRGGTDYYIVHLTGDQAMRLLSLDTERYYITAGSAALQQEILDLLLAHVPSEQQPQE